MPNSAPETKKYLPSVYTIACLIVMAAGFIWAGSKIDSKATEAHDFIKANRAVPEKICVLEKKMENVEKVIASIDVIQAEQRHIVKDMNGLNNSLSKLTEDLIKALKENDRRDKIDGR